MRLSRAAQLYGDRALAGMVALIGALSALTGATPLAVGGATSIAGPRPVVAASYAAAGAVLVFRRRAPLETLAAVVVILALPFLVFGSSEGFGAIAAAFVALYSVGAHVDVRRALAALAVFTAFWAVFELRDPLNPNLHSALGSWPVYLVGVMLLLGGAFLRTRRLYVAELRTRAEHAEADREERIRRATAEERARIARELHDAVAHAMSVMVMQAEAADEILDADPARARIAIERVQQAGREGLGEMRRLLGVLRRDESPALTPQPGVATLHTLIEGVCASGLPVQLTIEGEPRRLSTGVDISAYRIVQEALTNAIKHAGASAVHVRLRYGETLELEIDDDGSGPSHPGENGHGLIGMRERVALYGGTLDSGAVAGGGFRVRATLPTEQPA
jgi:signal transduction histidine kinase